MRILIQRVKQASVTIDNQTISTIGVGLMGLVGVENGDTREDIEYVVQKVSKLRIFDDNDGVMNLDAVQVGGEFMMISQFTLLAATKKGNRPSYIQAAKGEEGLIAYNLFCDLLEDATGKSVKRGKFGHNMQVSLCNDGPVTIWIDSRNK